MTRGGRCLLLALAAVLLAGATPPPKKKKRTGPIELGTTETYPVPPVPPSRRTPSQIAPVPDADITAPSMRQSTGGQFRPDFFSQRSYNGGQGYIPGSSIEGQQEQRQRPIPGFNWKMPLQ